MARIGCVAFLIGCLVAWASVAAETKLELKTEEALPIAVEGGQVLHLAGSFAGENTSAQIMVDGAKVTDVELKAGAMDAEVTLPVVAGDRQVTSNIEVQVEGKTLAAKQVVRKPVREMTIYIEPHSHVDIGYTQLQPEIEKKQVENLVRAMELIEKTKSNPEGSRYRWTVEASWTIDNFLKQRPEKVGELEAALKAGDVELDAAFANLLTGLCRPEELMRAYAWGAKYGKRFGVPVKTAQISDVPGYTWGTVAALAQAGVRYFSIGPNYMDRIGTTLTAWQDRPFYWRTPDGGGKVLCWVPFTGYGWSHRVKKIGREPVAALMRHLEEIDYPYDVTYVRWSGHGDNAVPDEAIIDAVKKWNGKYVWPKLKIATVSAAFGELEKKYGDKIPVVRGDWTPYWDDGAASSALETAMNRTTDERLVAAETLWAMLRPGEFPVARFNEAWRGAMLYSEHTWGAHCSISEPENPLTTGQWEYKRGYATGADAESRKLVEAALGGGKEVAGAVDVFNVSSWARSEVVVAPKELSAAGDRVMDEDGKVVASQRLNSGELAFVISDVPAMGFKRFVISAESAEAKGEAKAGNLVLENGRVQVRIDPTSGNVTSLRRESDAGELVESNSKGLNDYIYVEGDHFDRLKRPASSRVRVGEKGPLVASLVVESSDAPGCKSLTREVRLVSGSDAVEFIDVLDKLRAEVKSVKQGGKPQDANNGKEAVHFAFPFNVAGGQIRIDTPWAVVRPEVDQMPGSCKNWFTVQRWVDISNDSGGVTWSPIDAPLVQVGGITATLIGSQTNPAAWQTHVEPSTALYSWAMNNYWHTNYRAWQEGRTTFRYVVRPHGALEMGEVQRFGMERSQPLMVVAGRERGPMEMPRLKLEGDGVVVTAQKRADEGAGYVIRLFAAGGKDLDVPLVWEGKAPRVVCRSDSMGTRGEKVESAAIHLPAWGVVTLRVE